MSRLAHGEVRLPPDLVFPRSFTHRWAPSEETDAVRQLFGKDPQPYASEFTARWNDERLAYDVVRLILEPGYLGDPITAAGIRGFRVEEMLRAAKRDQVRTHDGEPVLPVLPDANHNELPEPERLLLAARTYVISRAFSDPPLQRVADMFKVSQSTATRLVARLRREGLVN